MTAEDATEKRAAIPFSPREFTIVQDGKILSVLHVEPHGAGISGDTSAALESLCEQLPGAFDLCRLIEEKLQLERELAERERMARYLGTDAKMQTAMIEEAIWVLFSSSEFRFNH